MPQITALATVPGQFFGLLITNIRSIRKRAAEAFYDMFDTGGFPNHCQP
jgi:hypothetical protein